MQKSSFFNSVNGDRRYRSEDWAEYFNTFLSNGVFPNPSSNLQVLSNNNMTVTVAQGKGWINGYYYHNTADLILNLDNADGLLKRIDRIVLRWDKVERNITAVVKKGIFAESPVPQTLTRNADFYELALADVFINNGAISISQANITDTRLNNNLCGIVHSTIEQVDATTLFNQYQDWYSSKQSEFNTNLTEYTSAKQNELNSFITSKTNEVNTWFNTTKNTTQTDVNNMKQQFQQEFLHWFESVQDVLDGDTAGNLLNLINDIKYQIEESQTTTLTNNSNFFKVGTGKDQNGNQVDISNSVQKGQVSITLSASNTVQILPYQTDKWRRCNLDDNGNVLAYHGSPNYKEDGSSGQVMVEIHKGYVYSEFEENQSLYYVSEIPAAGFKTHPAFIRNGKEIDKIYIGAYEASIYDVSSAVYLPNDEQVADFTRGTGDKLCSIANVKPCSGGTQNLTLPNSRILANNRGIGWELQDFWTISFIQLCLFIEHGTFDSQNAIGLGVVNKASGTGNEANNTGATSSLGNATGREAGTNGLTSVSYRGIENLWGNIWNWVDGINIIDNVPYVADHDFVSNKFDEHYEPLGVTLANSNGFVEDWASIQFGFLPTSVGTNKTGNHYWQASGARVALLGGAWGSGSAAGVACWTLSHSSTLRGRTFGARLLYVPQN